MSDSALPSDPAGLTLAELCDVLADQRPLLDGARETRVTGVRQDSRRVEPGDLFAARSGASAHGAMFVEEAVRRGARAILVDTATRVPTRKVPIVRVDGVRSAIARAAEAVYGFPSRRIPVVGITGTNGKTTTSFLVEHALSALGARPARLGTLGFSFEGAAELEQHTTPEADEVSRLLGRAVALGASHFVMEVSSHALEQERVAALDFEVAAFTNLTQDHLDFHGSMERYAAAKARLFTELSPKHAVFNVDDAFGETLSHVSRARVTRVSRARDADVRVLEARIDATGFDAKLLAYGEERALRSRLVGAHNLENCLVAFGVLVALGFHPANALSALANAPAVPGRLERCDEPADGVTVVVDYAHTPDALERVLGALRPLTAGRLTCVFGCGGDRDPGKRPKMGAVAAALCDFAVITNDNPRSEDPELIARAVKDGFEGSATPVVVELDRARAIELAVSGAAPGDTLLIAGKGHEDYQIFGSERRHFDDREQARGALARRRQALGSQS